MGSGNFRPLRRRSLAEMSELGQIHFAHWIEISNADVIGWTKINAPTCAVGEFPAWPSESDA